MRQMFIDYAQTQEGVELDIIVLDTEENKISRDKREYMGIARALEDTVTIIRNVNVDVVYSDKGGLGDIFTEALDHLLLTQKIKTVVHGVRHISHEAMYRPQEVSKHGHQAECLFRF